MKTKPFQRKPTLGHYNGTRREWIEAYRAARIDERNGIECDPAFDGLRWKAGLIASFERHDHNDPLTVPVENRMAEKRLIEEILAEEVAA